MIKRRDRIERQVRFPIYIYIYVYKDIDSMNIWSRFIFRWGYEKLAIPSLSLISEFSTVVRVRHVERNSI